MTTTYEKFLKLNIDAACVGLQRGEQKSDYFCTPKGAKVIGWTGVDGIHFCFVRGFGETVFVVSPMAAGRRYVHPTARSFSDFLRLLLACGDTAALEQVYMWDEARFDDFIRDNSITAEQQAVLNEIREKLRLTPMEQPYTYIKALQTEFDYGRIKYTEDYYEYVPAERKIPDWKVYFDGSFWGHRGRDRCGKEITLDKQFVWGGDDWRIPAIYSCSKGLVADFCVRVPAERIRSFMDKWALSEDRDSAEFAEERRMQIATENPLAVNIKPKMVLNGTALSFSHGSGLTWNPCLAEDNSFEAACVIQHYGLDPDCGWAFMRAAFPWAKKAKPQITTLSVTVAQEPVAISGPRFHVSSPGDSIDLTHPVTGERHTLTVLAYERQEMPRAYFDSHSQELPAHYIMLQYALSPELPDAAFTVSDCVRSDLPRQKRPHPDIPQEFGGAGASIGIIGGADGPTAVFVGGRGKLHAACSALHFEPADDVEWRAVFHVKTMRTLRLS